MARRATTLLLLAATLGGCVQAAPEQTVEPPPDECPAWAARWCAPPPPKLLPPEWPPCPCPPCPAEADCVACSCTMPEPPALLGELVVETALAADAEGAVSVAALPDGRVLVADGRHLLVRDGRARWDERAVPSPALGELRAPQALAQGEDVLLVARVTLAGRPLGLLVARSGDAGETWLETRTLVAHDVGAAPPVDVRAAVDDAGVAHLVLQGVDGVLRLVRVFPDGMVGAPEELWASDGGLAVAGLPRFAEEMQLPYVRRALLAGEPPLLGVALPQASRLATFAPEGGVAEGTWPTLSEGLWLRIHWVDVDGAQRSAVDRGRAWEEEPARGAGFVAPPVHAGRGGTTTSAWTDGAGVSVARSEGGHEGRAEERWLAHADSAPALTLAPDGRAVLAWEKEGALLVALER